ncbi:phosphorylase family protein [Tautonia plasticadhaerens]|uniref:5'-methylthioadenosine/S-adenosylhomocysteine nucleosidase n=1 Tax=Tautonia plasticadhaerens TaxID=2527974 RepID=A0A518H0C9_9BACT|nr:nucleoside phosphorylase [Tautonia plasticadhaerens]QDV34283.1 5'-methylthioadenosine/S-adenosylhomocysteine nucleosidase [Tautonia plasticadhaerens]
MTQLLPPPVPADVGIVAALPIEIGPTIDLLRDVRTYSDPEGSQRAVVEGMLGEKVVVIVSAGVGRKAAAKGARRLLGGHRPRWLVSAGFGGALDPGLRRNDVVFATEIVDAASPDAPPLAIGLTPPASTPGSKIRYSSGRLVTASKIVRTAAEKAAMRGRFAAEVVDMETASVASICADRGQRFLAIRVISDEAGADLPPEVMTVMGPTGGFRLGATIGALWKRPGSVKDLWTLREHAIEAADRLAEVLPGIIHQLD